MIKEYEIEVDCANCAKEMEEVVKNVKGIKNANINFIIKKMKVEFDDNLSEEEIKKVILEAKKQVKDNDDECDIII